MYASSTGKKYREQQTVEGGYVAMVGNTIFDYKNPNDLVINNSRGAPEIDDFKAIFQIEKKMGRFTLPISKMDDKEYMARLVTGAFEAGLTPHGAFRLEEKDIQKLSPETKRRYQKQLHDYDIKTAQTRKILNRRLTK